MEKNQNLSQQIRTLVGEGETEEILELLLESETNYAEEIYLLSHRFNQCKKDVNLNLISTDDAKVEMSQINRALLKLADDLEQMPSGHKGNVESDNLTPKPNNQKRKQTMVLASIAMVALLIVSFVLTKNSGSNSKNNTTVKSENTIWKLATADNTIESYNKYISKYPNGKYVQEAKRSKDLLKNSQRKIEVKLTNLVCEVSDDEGPNNDADMVFFKFSIESAKQGDCKNDKNKDIKPSDYILYEYNGKEVSVQKGRNWDISESKPIILEYDNENCSNIFLSILGKAIEQDESSSDEEAQQTFTLLRGEPANVNKTFYLKSNDFTYRCEFSVKKINW